MLRIGISGYNETAERFIATIENTHKVMLSGIHTESSVENAALAGTGLVVYNTFKELIQHSDLVLLLQQDTNALPQAEKVIKHGKHVYINDLKHFQDDYIGYLVNLSHEAGVKTFINFDLLYHPVVNELQRWLGDPQIIDVSLGRMEGSREDISGDRYLISAALLVKSLSRRIELPRLHAQKLHRDGLVGNPIQLRLEYPSGCLANVMLHGDAVPGHNRIKVYQTNGYTEADLDFGLIATQRYTDGPVPANTNNDALINVEAAPQPDAGLKHFINRLTTRNAEEDFISFSRLYDAVRSVSPVRQKMQGYGVSTQ